MRLARCFRTGQEQTPTLEIGEPPRGEVLRLGSWVLGRSFRSEAAMGLRRAPCALRGASAPGKNTRQLLQPASRRLQSAEDGTAVGDWVLPHQGKNKRQFLETASRELQLPEAAGPRPLGASAPGREQTFLLAIGEPATSVPGGKERVSVSSGFFRPPRTKVKVRGSP